MKIGDFTKRRASFCPIGPRDISFCTASRMDSNFPPRSFTLGGGFGGAYALLADHVGQHLETGCP
eukprot:9129713-Prorocentrum_lima.AAC.1